MTSFVIHTNSQTYIHTHARTCTQLYTNVMAPLLNTGEISGKLVLVIIAAICYIFLLAYLVWLPVKHAVALPRDVVMDVRKEDATLQEPLMS
jgi:hypothetical protein